MCLGKASSSTKWIGIDKPNPFKNITTCNEYQKAVIEASKGEAQEYFDEGNEPTSWCGMILASGFPWN